MPDRDTVFEQRLLEGEAAAEQEADEIVPPDIDNIIPKFGLTASKNLVPGAIGAQITSGRQVGGFDPSSIHPFQDRAWFGVFLAKSLKIGGIAFRQDHQIQLGKTGTTARGGFSPKALPDRLPELRGR
jgi:hypothetical protein